MPRYLLPPHTLCLEYGSAAIKCRHCDNLYCYGCNGDECPKCNTINQQVNQ